MTSTPQGSSPLPQFLRWLLKSYPEKARSQSDVSRRSGVSQSEIYKVIGNAHTRPRLDTIQKITSAYWIEWQEFLGRHEAVRKFLEFEYRWTRCEEQAAFWPGSPDHLASIRQVREVQ